MARVTKETLYLRHEFTNEEKLEMGTKLAEAHNRIAQITEEESVMKAQIKDRKAGVEASVGTLSRNLSSGFTMENVDCEVVYDLPNVGEVSYKRKDNGEIAKTRAMTAAENQTELEFAKAEAETTTAPAAESVVNIETFFGVGTTDAIKAADVDEEEEGDEDEDDEGEDEEDEEDEQMTDQEDVLAVFANPDPAAAAEALKPEHDAAWDKDAMLGPVATEPKRGRGRPKGSTKKEPELAETF